ncbi:MAG: hypothetical protein JWO11_2590 [Nocardioides sp.]|nr:hypothetical protein [Nocardioides sp.]
MYNVNILQAEIDYRANRIKTGMGGGKRRRHVRTPFVRRPAESSDNAR